MLLHPWWTCGAGIVLVANSNTNEPAVIDAMPSCDERYSTWNQRAY